MDKEFEGRVDAVFGKVAQVAIVVANFYIRWQQVVVLKIRAWNQSLVDGVITEIERSESVE